MAREQYKTPLCQARYCHLIKPRPQMDASKPPAWGLELLLDNSNPTHVSFLTKVEDIYLAHHGSKKRRSKDGIPVKPDKDDPDGTSFVRFKLTENTFRDGSKVQAPRIVDAQKRPWNGDDIGNGSELIVVFDVYDWDGDNGAGITLQPRAVQVVKFVPYVRQDPTDQFDEIEGGYSVENANSGEDWSLSDDEEVPF